MHFSSAFRVARNLSSAGLVTPEQTNEPWCWLRDTRHIERL